MVAATLNVFLMSCGSPEYRFPDDWMTTEKRSNDSISDSHIHSGGRATAHTKPTTVTSPPWLRPARAR